MGAVNIAAGPVVFRGSGELLKNPAATEALKSLFGVSPARLSSMDQRERAEFLEGKMKSLREQGQQKLAADLSDLFQKISRGESRWEGELKALKARMPKEKTSILNLVGKKPADTLSVLRGRVLRGELSSSAVEKFSATVRRASQALGFNILGDSADNCLKTFSPPLVTNFMNLVSSLQSPRAVVNTQAAFNAIVAKSKTMFGENLVDAQKRVCSLAGQGNPCRALAPQMCVL